MKESLKIRQINRAESPPKELFLLADPSVDQIARYIDGAIIFVAEDDDRIIGVCAVSETSQSEFEIHNIAVAERSQVKGIGSRLIRHVINFVDQQRADSLVICTADTSTDQLHLYQKVGFKEESREKDYFLEHYQEPILENGRQCRD